MVAGSDASDARDESGEMGACGSNANRAAIGAGACVADFDVIGCAGDVYPGLISDGDIEVSGCVVVQRLETNAGILVPGGVGVQRAGSVLDPLDLRIDRFAPGVGDAMSAFAINATLSMPSTSTAAVWT